MIKLKFFGTFLSIAIIIASIVFGIWQWSNRISTQQSITSVESIVDTKDGKWFDVYPSGYRVSVLNYEFIETNDSIRIYFLAEGATSKPLSPEGSLLITQDGNFIYPLAHEWVEDEEFGYKGWFEFENKGIKTETNLGFYYCGCGYYDVPLPNFQEAFDTNQ